MKLIGINGKAEHGKSTAAGFLLAVFPNLRCVNFADELKLQALEAWPYMESHPYKPYLHLLTDERKIAIANNLKANAAFRSFLQDYGQEKRAEDPEYWIRACFARHQRLYPGHGLVIADVRYRNELDAVLTQRGLAIRIERRGFSSHLTPAQREHSSETDLDDFDWGYVPLTGRVDNPSEPVRFLENVLEATRGYMGAYSATGGQ